MTDRNSGVHHGLRFIGLHFPRMAALSALLLIPCFWHRYIEAGDLASHTYNAWLAQLMQQGKAPGIYTVWQWTNVLFDLALLYSAKVLGFFIGPKVIVAICVLVFFWGVFSFVTAASGHPPWMLTPLLAMLSYGYTFNMGFFNYYLSIGLGCFALALFWNAQKWDWLAGGLFLCGAVLAHPIGSLWCVATLVYVLIRRRIPGFWKIAVPAAAIGIFIAVHWYLAHAAYVEVDWLDRPFYLFNGTDQLILYTARTRWIASACLTILGTWFAYECLEWKQYLPDWKRLSLFVELYLLSVVITALLPQDILPDPKASWVGLLVSRLTVITAIFGLCVLGSLKPRRLAGAALSVCAIPFFIFLYQDTAAISRLELHAEKLIEKLPYGTLVIPTVLAPNSRIPFVGHVIDRACIGHCFTYSNYELSSRQFRLRARPGSLLATSSARDSEEMEAGNYVVRETDPSLLNIYQCNPDDFTVLCVRPLSVGDTSGPAGGDGGP